MRRDLTKYIIDRDRESFVSSSKNNQYKYVVEKCEEMGFGLYVTNPCFEFWLLLHFDKVFELDRDKLLENPKVTAKRRYCKIGKFTRQQYWKAHYGYAST